MRPSVVMIMLVLGSTAATTAAAGPDVRGFVRFGGSGLQGALSIGIGPTPMPISKPPGAAALEREFHERNAPRSGNGRHGRRDGDLHRRHPHDGHPHRHFPALLLGDDDEDEPERIVVVPATPAAPEPPPAAAPAAPPPDPRGPRFVPVRGTVSEPAYNVGEPLPDGVPFVTLGWEHYGLPEPPPGLVYARVGRDVVLLDPATRMVTRRVDPEQLRASAATPEPG